MLLKRIMKFVMLAIRLGLGIVLVFCTTLVAGIGGQLSFGHHLPIGTRLVFVLLSLFFALQSYAVCRILIFRRRARSTGLDFRPPVRH
jgi:hypothetical protein